jgi:hypothetical protein
VLLLIRHAISATLRMMQNEAPVSDDQLSVKEN